MATTIAVRFPLGHYHGTPWDRSLNEGAVEWPPSPWRILRALIATWYTRWPDLPAVELDALLAHLDQPPSYRTPPTRPGHTRHYQPALEHRTGETGATDLTLDAFLSLPRDADLLIHWNTALPHTHRASLAKLLELLPYLGRADSICQARLLDTPFTPDDTWWQPATTGDRTATRLLAPTSPVSRPILETTTTAVRQGRRTMPPGTRWIAYRAPATAPPATAGAQQPRTIAAIRYAVHSQAPFRATHGVLLADAVHQRAARNLDGTDTTLIFGSNGAATDHQHAHWIPLPDHTGVIRSVIVWAPAHFTSAEVARLADLTSRQPLNGRAYRNNGATGIRGFPETRLLLQAVGPIEQVAPELCGPARRWRSLTPYLPVRHRKRRTIHDHLTADIHQELQYRNHHPDVTVYPTDPSEQPSDHWSHTFRRYRTQENLRNARPGRAVHLESTHQINGPLTLGALSHFGFGLFTPEQ